MRAVLHEKYGPPDVLRVGEVERPDPKEDEVLVRVHASTVTRGDTELRNLAYPFSRLFTGISRPRRRIAGTEFAGVVADTGPTVTEFRAGDHVFGIAEGANAGYVTVPQGGVIALKPQNLTLIEAAAIPDGALLALSCLRSVLPLAEKGVLVYGAGGSIGSAAVQLLANYFHAEVTAVCDTKDVDLITALGARQVIDRLHQDFTKAGRTYDLIFDAVGKHSFFRCRRSLSRRGSYVTVGLGSLYHVPLLVLLTRLVGRRRARLAVGAYGKDDLFLVRDLVEAGKYRPVIDRIYGLDDVLEANRYVETGQKTGNVVLRIWDGD